MSRSLLALSLGLMLASAGRAQPVFYTVETLDWMAADSQVVVRAVVADFVQEVDDAKQPWSTVVIKVRETLKGPHKPFHTFVIPSWDHEKLPRWKKTRQELLLFLAASKPPDPSKRWWWKKATLYDLTLRNGSWSVIELVDATEQPTVPLPKVYTLDLQDPTKPREILRYTRSAIAAAGKIKQLRAHTFRWPWGAVNLDRVVPVDERLERQARRWIASDDPTWRWEGARALHYFKSDENVAALKKLLKDPSFVTHVRQMGERVIQTQREYKVRQAAFASLRAWDVLIPTPVVLEPLPPKK